VNLSIWTIYYRPTDYPDGYIARRHEVLASGPLATDDTVKADDLWTLRKHFTQAGLSCINRHAQDDAKIVESWL
jgi:hypothetical protein